MGFQDADLLDFGDITGGGQGQGGGGKVDSAIPCSICLEDVNDYGDRAWAKLHCGHQFHLDCIGSAFNVKGAMQCPNCRKIEKGQWLYADGGRPYPELIIDDLVNDEDLYDPNYSELSIWCPPYDGFAQLAATYNEVEVPTTAYHEVVGQHGVFSERAATVSSATNMCPYIAYVQPLHPSTSTSNGAQGPRYTNNLWNSQSASSEMPNSYYHATTHVLTDADIRRPSRTTSAHPFLVGQSSGGRGPSTVGSSMNHRAGERSHSYFQQPIRAPGPQRSNQVVASSDQSRGGVYYTGRSIQETENSMLNLVHHIWERDPPHVRPIERGPFHQAVAGGFGQRHGTPSQSRYWS